MSINEEDILSCVKDLSEIFNDSDADEDEEAEEEHKFVLSPSPPTVQDDSILGPSAKMNFVNGPKRSSYVFSSR